MENTACIKKIYLVGGAVRDSLLGIPLKDKDYVAVGFSEDDFKHLKRVGKSFPVFLQKNGTQIALARSEKKTAPGYNGFIVEVDKVTLEDDLRRRDLTINAIAYDEDNKSYIDPFGGINDLKNKILRHVSTAFSEDPLRVLRVARFRARLGVEWKIYAETKVLIYNMKDELESLEKNRVFKEVESAFLQNNSQLFFETLFELGILKFIFPQIYQLTTLKEGNLHHLEASVFAHTMEVLKYTNYFFTKLPKECKSTKNSLILQFAALYHDIAKPHCYREFGNSNGHDNAKIVESFLDITLPHYIKKPMLLLISNHIRIAKLKEMKASKVLQFLDSFKGNLELFYLQITLFLADKKGRISYVESKVDFSDFTPYINAFIAIKNLSIKKWCEEKKPSVEQIKGYLLKQKLEILKNALKT
ncbi:MAG: HD domain-containing protein [Helicobacter sp.]|nr:HD domain-containing protein [Helicobacteraceae bacterium]MDY3114060.1 HD domain-containing protein [Helicobacter sp.]